MSRFGLRPLLCAAMLFIAGALGAQNSQPPAMGPKAQEVLKRFDKNADGKLDDDERADAQEVMMKERVEKQIVANSPAALDTVRTRLYEKFDQNKDGKLDPEERATAAKAVEERLANETSGPARAQLFRRFDRNADGKLGAEESLAVVQFFAELPAVAPVPAAAAAGVASREDPELRQIEKVIRAAIEADAMARERFDQNKDGKIDEIEWSGARPQLARFFGGRGFTVQERERLERVAEEVERRRTLRGEAPGLKTPPQK